MKVYAGTHPVFVSHAKELEQMAYFLADLQHRLQIRKQDSGERYDCLVRVRKICADLLLKMYAEDSNIILMDDLDHHWVQLIVGYVKTYLLPEQQKAG